jgi:hypothetical protein
LGNREAGSTGHVEKMEEYAHATEAGNGESSEPLNNQLRQLVLYKMGNMLDWRGMLSLCRFKKNMPVMKSGATCDNSEKVILKSNLSKLRSTMRMFGISELTGHLQYRQCQVAEKLKVIHRLQHVLSVVEYGLDYLEYETLSRVENCIPCLLHCKKRVIDKIVRMFFIRAQESALQKSKAEEVRRIISIHFFLIYILWEDLVILDPSKSHMMRRKQHLVTSQWMALLPLVCLQQWMMDLFIKFLGNIHKFQRQKKKHGQQSSRCCMPFLKHYHCPMHLVTVK